MREVEHPGELVFFSTIAGAIAAPIKLIAHHLFVWTGLAKPFYMMLTASMVHGHMTTNNIVDFLFGELGDMSIGALFGIILGIWLKISRTKYHWWIGISYGVGIWFLSLAFGNLTKSIKSTMTDPWSLFAHLVAMLTFSVLFVVATKIWKPLKVRIDSPGWNKGKATHSHERHSLMRFYFSTQEKHKKDKDLPHFVKPKKL